MVTNWNIAGNVEIHLDIYFPCIRLNSYLFFLVLGEKILKEIFQEIKVPLIWLKSFKL